MAEENVQLIAPTAELEGEYRAFLDEFRAAGQGDQLSWSSGSDTNCSCFASYLARLRDAERGVGLPDDQPPNSTFWLVRGRRILGTCNLRHWLDQASEEFGEHIGYCVRPSERRKGYGTQILAMVLRKAAEMGIDEALLECGYDNPGSIGVIENNGGRLISEGYSQRARWITRRYLVPTHRGSD